MAKRKNVLLSCKRHEQLRNANLQKALYVSGEARKHYNILESYHGSIISAQKRYNRILTSDEKKYIYKTHMERGLDRVCTFIFNK